VPSPLGLGETRRLALLERLLPTLAHEGAEAHQSAVSGESLGKVLGLSRAAVHKHVEHLRAVGFAVESSGGAGYRLARSFTDLVAPEAVLPHLLECLDPKWSWAAGLPYHYQARCPSTNAVLRQEAASSPSGTVVVTDEQTGGRGRLGRTWVSEPGKDLTFSVLVLPSLAPAQVHLLSLAAALAVADAVDELLHAEGGEGLVQVKWPNDVLLDGKKVCGVLLEGSLDSDRVLWAIAGIGLNVNSAPSDMISGLGPEKGQDWQGRPQPLSLREHLGREVPRAPLLAALLCSLTRRWTEAGAPDLLDDLRGRDALAGRRIEVFAGPPGNEPVVAGEAAGIGPEGQLLVLESTGRTVPVFAGEVTVRQPVNPTTESG
jgi:BirA family biotin operon repressor/biotin-[acetyl-CoA-carboxylase] ligase